MTSKKYKEFCLWTDRILEEIKPDKELEEKILKVRQKNALKFFAKARKNSVN